MWLQRKRQLELVVPFLPKQNLFVIIFADHWDATWLDFLSVMKWWKEYQRNVFSYVNCWFCKILNYVCSLVVILLDARPTDNTSIVVDCKKLFLIIINSPKKCFEIEYNMIFGIKRIHHTSNLYKLFTNNGTSVQKLLHYCRTLVFLDQTSFICILCTYYTERKGKWKMI